MALMKNALTRPAWRGRTNVDLMTITAIEQAERLADFQFDVTQGSYQGGAGDSKSAGTHDGGGVVDLRTRDLTADQKRRMIRALRRVGFAAWLRTPAQGFTEHVHAVLGGHPLLAPAAARQWDAYLAGRNGLASNGPDDGPRINPIPTFNASEEDDMFSDDDRETLARTFNNARTSRIASIQGRNAARAAVNGIGELAKLIKTMPGAGPDLQALADDIVARTAAEVERLDAAAVADQLEITVKEA